MKIYNGTPHSINVVEGATFDGAIRKWTGGHVVLSIPSDGMLNAVIKTADGPTLEGGIPTFRKQVVGCDPLPEGYDVYVVSLMYASAHGQTQHGNLYTVADPVMSDDGRTFVGCRGLQQY